MEGRLLSSPKKTVQRKRCRLALGKNFQPAWEKRGRAEGFHHREGLDLGGSILPRILGNPVLGQSFPAQEPLEVSASEQSMGHANFVVCGLVCNSDPSWDSEVLDSSVSSFISFASLVSGNPQSNENNNHGLPTSVVK